MILDKPLEHEDVIEHRHRFPAVIFHGESWSLHHLDAFAFRIDPNLGFEIDVVVLFSCHCFTHSIKRDARALLEIPCEEIYDNGLERRVLSKERYELSRRFLPMVIKDLERRTIRFGRTHPQNFFITEYADAASTPGIYAVFFEVMKDRRRKRRVLLYVKSAYRVERLSRRLLNASKVRLVTLLRAAYRGDAIHG